MHKAPGTAKASDQLENDKSVRALLHNYRTKRPLVLIIDDKYALFPYDLGSRDVTYAVLGWYQIVHAWGTYRGGGADNSQLTFSRSGVSAGCVQCDGEGRQVEIRVPVVRGTGTSVVVNCLAHTWWRR